MDKNGIFRIPVPESIKNNTIECNLHGELVDAACFYAANAGTSAGLGTEESPLSFQGALEAAKDGDRIVVLDEIVLPVDFVWSDENKMLTVSGKGNGAALNIHMLESQVLKIGTDTTFENIELASTQSGDAAGAGIIRAYGNVVTIEESVTTRGIFAAFYGGGRNWDEVDKTESYIYGGNFSRIYGGGGHVKGDCKLTVGGNTNTTAGVDPSDENNKTFKPYIYGGTLDNTVDGDCITTVTGGAGALYLYGGSQDVKEDATRGSGVKGKTVVNIQGGKFMNVYGMNPPTDADDTSDVTINMTGGTVEALIGSSADTLADSIKGTVTINATGGTVTRRIIGGVYNESYNSDNNKYITGDVNVVIGLGLQGMTDKQIGHGIFGGSRRKSNPEQENAKLIFVGGSHDTFGKHVDADTWDCDSHHDYLITGTQGGSITPQAGNAVAIVPLAGYIALTDNSLIESESYILTKKETDVIFRCNAIDSLYGSATSTEITATVNYVSDSSSNVMILALYDGEEFAALSKIDVRKGQNSAQQIKIPYIAASGKTYTLKAFLWKDMKSIVPLCQEKETNIQ